MTKSLLLTSFATWRAYQKSNSSDDLLLETLKTRSLPMSLHLLRQLPVNLPVAQGMTIAKLEKFQPHGIICCGMAESRTQLTVESRAVVRNHVLHTTINLENLIAGLSITEISQDAGRFVCNSLYYAMLNHLQQHDPDKRCLFVHVPVLTPNNREAIVADFRSILKRVTSTES